MSKAGMDKYTAELFFSAQKSLRGKYVQGIERSMDLVAQMLTLMATGPDDEQRLMIRKQMIGLIDKFYSDMKTECYQVRPLDQKWINKLNKKLRS